MKILQINTSLSPRGADRVMYRLHQEFLNMGHDPRILVKKAAITGKNIFELPKPIQIKSSWISQKINALFIQPDVRLGFVKIYPTKKIRKMKIFQDADLLQLHNIHGRYFNYHKLPEFATAKPIIWTLHDMWALTGHCTYSYNCQRWRTGCFKCPLLQGSGRQIVHPKPILVDRTRTIWTQKREVYADANMHIVTPSKWLLDLAKDSILKDSASLQCIPNGLDLDLFFPIPKKTARHQLGIPQEAQVILFIAASLSDVRKGFSYLLDVLGKMAKSNMLLLLTIGDIGKPDERLQKHNRKDLGVLTEEKSIVLALSASDIFVFPTLADNQPLVVIEALACGTPIVSFNVGGVSEMVHHMETGYLACYKDIDDFVSGLELLLRERDLRHRIQRQCRKVAEMEYGIQLQTNRYLELYEQAILEHKNRSLEK